MGQGCRDWQWTPSQFTRRRTFEVEGNCSAAGSFLAFFYTLKPVNKFMGANGTAPLRPSIPPNVGSRANKLIGHWEGRSHIVTYNYVRISNHMVRNRVFRMFIQQWNVRSNNYIQTCLNGEIKLFKILFWTWYHSSQLIIYVLIKNRTFSPLIIFLSQTNSQLGCLFRAADCWFEPVFFLP